MLLPAARITPQQFPPTLLARIEFIVVIDAPSTAPVHSMPLRVLPVLVLSATVLLTSVRLPLLKMAEQVPELLPHSVLLVMVTPRPKVSMAPPCEEALLPE